MAVPMTVNDIISLTAIGRLDDQVVMNVFHYRLTSLGSLTAFPTWAVALNDKLNDAAELSAFYTNCLSEDVTDLRWFIQKIYPTRLVKHVGDMDPDIGAIAESALPPGTQASLTKRALVAGKHAIGGIRMPGVPVTASEGGYISSAYKVLLTNLRDSLQAPITSVTIGTITPIIFNRSNPAGSLDIDSITPEDTMRTIRRRVVGRGI